LTTNNTPGGISISIKNTAGSVTGTDDPDRKAELGAETRENKALALGAGAAGRAGSIGAAAV
jgi:hypothetical protein